MRYLLLVVFSVLLTGCSKPWDKDGYSFDTEDCQIFFTQMEKHQDQVDDEAAAAPFSSEELFDQEVTRLRQKLETYPAFKHVISNGGSWDVRSLLPPGIEGAAVLSGVGVFLTFFATGNQVNTNRLSVVEAFVNTEGEDDWNLWSWEPDGWDLEEFRTIRNDGLWGFRNDLVWYTQYHTAGYMATSFPDLKSGDDSAIHRLARACSQSLGSGSAKQIMFIEGAYNTVDRGQRRD